MRIDRKQNMNGRKKYLLITMLLEWITLIVQLYLHLKNSPAGPAESLIRFFSFFTILTNLLVAVYLTVLWSSLATAQPKSIETGFWFRPSVQTAIALYILIVGLIFNLILRSLWDYSDDLQTVVNELLHTVIPLLLLIYWWIWVDGRRLRYADIPAWLIYPAVYACYILIRGHFAAWYPYPFMDVVKNGYSKVLINSSMMVGVFVLFALLFVFFGKRKRSYA